MGAGEEQTGTTRGHGEARGAVDHVIPPQAGGTPRV